MNIIEPAAKGFLISAGLIIAIGAQNAFVLRQGLKKEHIVLVVVISSLCDAGLTFIGVNGLGKTLANSQVLTRAAAFMGAAFLFYYAVKAFRSALRPGQLEVVALAPVRQPRRTIALQSVAFSILNPHAVLDTVVLIGSVGAQFPVESRQFFLAGALTASIIWFSALGFAASQLAPLFSRSWVWRGLDFCIGSSMFCIAISLIA